MSPECAKNIMEGLAWLSMPIDKIAFDVSSGVDDQVEKIRMLKQLGDLWSVFLDLQNLIVEQHPDLNPSGKWKEEFFQAKVKYQAEGYPPKRITEEQLKLAEEAGLIVAGEIKNND